MMLPRAEQKADGVNPADATSNVYYHSPANQQKAFVTEAYDAYLPQSNQGQPYKAIRRKAAELACLMAMHCPKSDELDRALEHLSIAATHADALISRNQ